MGSMKVQINHTVLMGYIFDISTMHTFSDKSCLFTVVLSFWSTCEFNVPHILT